jgi:hypothetical protein
MMPRVTSLWQLGQRMRTFSGEYSPPASMRCLSHGPSGHQDEDEIRRAYNRSTYLPERVKLMQQWADLLGEFKRLPLRHVA